MKFKKFKSSLDVSVNTKKYEIDWNRRVSKPQKKVKDVIKNIWENDYILEEFLIPGSKKRIDLLNWTKKIIIEVSPSGSHEYNQFFHKNRSLFYKTLKIDQEKKIWALNNGFSYLFLGDKELIDLDIEKFCLLLKTNLEHSNEEDEV